MLKKGSSSFFYPQLFIEEEESMRNDEAFHEDTQYYKDSFYQDSIESCSSESMYLSLDPSRNFSSKNHSTLPWTSGR
jgi:hypothetical protein